MSEQFPPAGPPAGWGPPPDAKAQRAAEKAYRKAQRPLYKKKRVIVPGVFVLLMIIIAASNSGGKKDDTSTTAAGTSSSVSNGSSGSSTAPAVSSKTTDAAKNVTATACEVSDLGGSKFSKVSYTINNPTSKSSTYFVEFSVVDSTGAKVSSANGIEPNVLPGRPSQGEAMGNVSGSSVAPYTCEVGKVTRTADPS